MCSSNVFLYNNADGSGENLTAGEPPKKFGLAEKSAKRLIKIHSRP
jgi:hypothetical protein